MLTRHSAAEVGEFLRYIDRHCPWFYVEWRELNGPEWPEGLPGPGDPEFEDRRDVA